MAQRIHFVDRPVLRHGDLARAEVLKQDLHARHRLCGQKVGVHGRQFRCFRCKERLEQGAAGGNAFRQLELRHEDRGGGGGRGRASEGLRPGGWTAETHLPDPWLDGRCQVGFPQRLGDQERVLPLLEGKGLLAQGRLSETQSQLACGYLRAERMWQIHPHDLALQRVQPVRECRRQLRGGLAPLQFAVGLHEAGPPQGFGAVLRHFAVCVHHSKIQGWLRWRLAASAHRAGGRRGGREEGSVGQGAWQVRECGRRACEQV
mmetsp:Transcript_34599/g.87488  ORF Transcript_34599/g.87488 Transcript_34599/m.87488 type:complete len:261 (-) Transcript_34599:626-1408(-)